MKFSVTFSLPYIRRNSIDNFNECFMVGQPLSVSEGFEFITEYLHIISSIISSLISLIKCQINAFKRYYPLGSQMKTFQSDFILCKEQCATLVYFTTFPIQNRLNYIHSLKLYVIKSSKSILIITQEMTTEITSKRPSRTS